MNGQPETGQNSRIFEQNAAGRVYGSVTDFPADADCIRLHGLGLTARLGVPESERALPQRLEADLTLFPSKPLSGLRDELAGTIDYSAVAEACRETAARGERRLLETLTEELADLILQNWPVCAVRVTLHKFILPDTRAVSVSLLRRAPGSSF